MRELEILLVDGNKLKFDKSLMVKDTCKERL